MVEIQKRGDGRKGRGWKKKISGDTLPPTVIFVSAETLSHVTTPRFEQPVNQRRSSGEEIFE